jgi:hypothetical protein
LVERFSFSDLVAFFLLPDLCGDLLGTVAPWGWGTAAVAAFAVSLTPSGTSPRYD